MFKTSISLSEALSKVVMILHRRPELMAGRRAVAGDEDSKSMVEQSADIIQKIFTSCLTDRSSTRFAKPEGKKVGVYIFANLVLGLLFAVSQSFDMPLYLSTPASSRLTCSSSAASLASQRSYCLTYQQVVRLFNYTQQLSALRFSIIWVDSTSTLITSSGRRSAYKRHTFRRLRHCKSTGG